MVAMILSIALAFAVGSYISLALGTLRSATRSFYYNTAFNVAEAGLEEALWALNNDDWTQRAWAESGTARILTGALDSPDVTDANGIRSYYNVIVENAAASAPTITAEGVVAAQNGGVVRKQLRVNARASNLFMPPFTAITALDLNGGQIDSYQMDSDGDGIYDQNYATAPRRYETTVASPSLTIGDISIGSPADIYGYVTVGVGASNASGFISDIKGSVTGPTTAAGQDGVTTAGSNLIDTNRIAYDFYQSFPMPTAPTETFTDPLPAADANGMIVLGDPTGATVKRYLFTNYTVPNKETLLVVGPVEIKVSGSLTVGGQSAVTVLTGTCTITPSKGADITYTAAPDTETTDAPSLIIYAYGDLSISGNGALTGGTIPGANIGADPMKLQIYGLAPESQDISIGGNGNFAASVYAPHADIVFNGGGSGGYFAGATVANNITVNGSGYRIRYPEEMANMSNSSIYIISRWLELTDRSTWHNFAAN